MAYDLEKEKAPIRGSEGKMSSELLEKKFSELVSQIFETIKNNMWLRRRTVFITKKINNYGLIQFQESTKSNKYAIIFTVNIAVICGDLMDLEGFDAKKM
jgi:hypothetical protein